MNASGAAETDKSAPNGRNPRCWRRSARSISRTPTTRKLLGPLCAVGLCVIANSASAAPETVSGWGPFRFGMTEQQAIKVSKGDIRSEDGKVKDILDFDAYIGPYAFVGNLYFFQLPDKLSGIRLSLKLDKITDCSAQTKYILSELTQKYGKPTQRIQSEKIWLAHDGSKITYFEGGAGCPILDYDAKPPPIIKAGV